MLQTASAMLLARIRELVKIPRKEAVQRSNVLPFSFRFSALFSLSQIRHRRDVRKRRRSTRLRGQQLTRQMEVTTSECDERECCLTGILVPRRQEQQPEGLELGDKVSRHCL